MRRGRDLLLVILAAAAMVAVIAAAGYVRLPVKAVPPLLDDSTSRVLAANRVGFEPAAERRVPGPIQAALDHGAPAWVANPFTVYVYPPTAISRDHAIQLVMRREPRAQVTAALLERLNLDCLQAGCRAAGRGCTCWVVSTTMPAGRRQPRLLVTAVDATSGRVEVRLSG